MGKRNTLWDRFRLISMNSQPLGRIKSFDRYLLTTPSCQSGQLFTSPFVKQSLLWLQAACQLFTAFHLPSARDLPSIQIESRPAELVMTVTDF